MIINPLRLVAFELSPEFCAEPLRLYSLPFPDAWRPALGALQAELSGRADQANTIPVRSLNAVLETLVPQLLAVPRMVARPDERTEEGAVAGQRVPEPWLVAKTPLPTSKLLLVVRAWLEQTFRDCPSFGAPQSVLRAEDLHWDRVEYPLLLAPSPNGTAVPSRMAYTVLPGLLVEHLMESDLRFRVGGEERALRRTVSGDNTTLMTWPPAYHTDSRHQRWAYSYTVTATLQTVPGDDRPRLYFHYGVRRWASRPLLEEGQLRMGRNARRVCLHTTEPWLSLGVSHSFSVGFLIPEWQENQRIPVWKNRITDIVRRLGVPFPDAESLARDPMMWLTGGDAGVEAGIVEPSSARHHGVGVGLGLEVHKDLTERLADKMPTGVSLCPAPEAIASVTSRPRHPLMCSLRERPESERLLAFQESVGANVTIEIHWDSETVRDMLVDRLLAVLCRPRPALEPLGQESAVRRDGKQKPRKRLPEPEPEVIGESLPDTTLPGGGRVQILLKRLGELGAPFPVPETGVPGTRAEYKRRQTEQRAREVVRQLGEATEPTLALIELLNYQDPQKPKLRREFGWRDPKLPLRLGHARTGRVSQFVTPDGDELRHRCEGAVRDGLRHLGFLPAPIGITAKALTGDGGLPDDMLVAAVWQIRLTKKRSFRSVYLPVVVLMHTRHFEVRAWVPGLGVQPYREALCSITTMDPEQVSRRRYRDRALGELRQFLLNDLMHEGAGTKDILVLAATQNARGLWQGLENGSLAWDAVRFERGAEPIAGDQLRGRVRLIRLRTNERNETPEWFTAQARPGAGFVQGVWRDPLTSRVFYNLAGKSHTQAGPRRGKQVNPGEHTTLPSLVEVIPAVLQEGDDPQAWVHAIDQWRRMGTLVSDSMLLLPLPLAYARKMDEYASTIGPWVLPDEWPEEEEDEEEEESEG